MQTLTAEKFENFCDSCARFLCSPAGVVLSTVLVLIASLLWNPSADRDLFARVAIGRLISHDGIYLFDPFAFTPKKPFFIDHEWFAGYLFYWIARVAGDRGIILFSLSTVVLSVVFLHKAAAVYSAKSGGIFFPCFFFGVIQCVYIWGSFVRSQVFTYMFLPLVFLGIVLYEQRGERKGLLLLPLIMVVWANSHGGFVTGFGFILLYLFVLAVRREWRKASFVGVICLLMVAVTSVNPYGFMPFWMFVIEAVSMPRPSISEWGVLSPLSWENLFNYFYFAVALWGIYLSQRRMLPVLFLVVSLWQGIAHLRLLAIPAMVVVVFFEEEFEAAARRLCRPAASVLRASAFSISGLAAAAFCFIVYRLATLPPVALDYSAYPLEATEWLRNSGLTGNILVDFNTGSFVMWRLYPEFLISLDGRYEEVYPEDTVVRVSEAMEPESMDFLKCFQEVAPDFALFPSGERVRKALALLPQEWRVFKFTEKFTVLGKGSPPPGVSTEINQYFNVWEPRL